MGEKKTLLLLQFLIASSELIYAQGDFFDRKGRGSNVMDPANVGGKQEESNRQLPMNLNFHIYDQPNFYGNQDDQNSSNRENRRYVSLPGSNGSRGFDKGDFFHGKNGGKDNRGQNNAHSPPNHHSERHGTTVTASDGNKRTRRSSSRSSKSGKKGKKGLKSYTGAISSYDKDFEHLQGVEYESPFYWNVAPIIDWDKFYEKDPDNKVPMTFSQPQRYAPLDPREGPRFDHTSWYWVHDENRTGFDDIAKYPGVKAGRITEDLFEQIVGPHPNSALIPEPFRNGLFWMEGNAFPEELKSFNRFAWRSQTGGNGRVIGLGKSNEDLTWDPTTRAIKALNNTNIFSIQQSPNKKWFKIAFIGFGEVLFWMSIYVIQDGDVFRYENGEAVPNIKPGDCLSIHYKDDSNPYEVSPATINYMYFFRKVAVYNEETGLVDRISPHYEKLLEKVNTLPPQNLMTAAYLTPMERFDLKTSMVSDTQLFKQASTSPVGGVIENL